MIIYHACYIAYLIIFIAWTYMYILQHNIT